MDLVSRGRILDGLTRCKTLSDCCQCALAVTDPLYPKTLSSSRVLGAGARNSSISLFEIAPLVCANAMAVHHRHAASEEAVAVLGQDRRSAVAGSNCAWSRIGEDAPRYRL